MNKKFKIVFIILSSILIGLSSGSFAQEFGTNVKQQEGKVTLEKENEGFKPDVRVSLGTSFSSFGPGFNSFGTYVAPEISMPVTNKFSLQLGLGYSNMYFNSPGETMFAGNNSQYGSIYVSGTYLVNEKLRLRGTAYKTFLMNPPPPGEQANPYMSDFSNQGFILDMDYNVTDDFSIGISIEYREQNYPAFYPYGPNRMNGFDGYGSSPFQSDPFFNNGF